MKMLKSINYGHTLKKDLRSTPRQKAQFCKLVSVANSWQNIPAGLEKKKKHFFLILRTFTLIKLPFEKR